MYILVRAVSFGASVVAATMCCLSLFAQVASAQTAKSRCKPSICCTALINGLDCRHAPFTLCSGCYTSCKVTKNGSTCLLIV